MSPRLDANRLFAASGILAMLIGAAWLLPALAACLENGTLEARDVAVASIGFIFILMGIVALVRRPRAIHSVAIPASARAVMAGNALFLAFCALEFSDGLIRQGGRIFYWTSVLFFPALALFFGLIRAQRWAWRAARIVTSLFAAWFIGFMFLIPFVYLRGEGGAIPWWGRIYVACVTLVFAGVSTGAFRLLGRPETRTFYGLIGDR